MVKITNGVDIFEVTIGAFKGIYSHQGYTLYDEKVEKQPAEGNQEPEKSDDEKFLEEIMEKPISQWSKDEVKKFAKLKSVDITDTKNVNEAKERIKTFLDSEE